MSEVNMVQSLFGQPYSKFRLVQLLLSKVALLARNYENFAWKFCSLMSIPWYNVCFPIVRCRVSNVNTAVHTSWIVQDWFWEHEGDLSHLSYPLQSPYLNIFEHLWFTLERKLRDTIHFHHHYLKIDLFCRKNGIIFPCKSCKTCIHPYKETANCYEYQSFPTPYWYDNEFIFYCFHIFVQPL